MGVVNMVIDGSLSSEELFHLSRMKTPMVPFAVEFCLDGKCHYAGACTEDSCNTKENILKTLKSAEEAIAEAASSGVSMKGTFISMALSLFMTFVVKSLM